VLDRSRSSALAIFSAAAVCRSKAGGDGLLAAGQSANLAVVSLADEGEMSLDGYLPSHSFCRGMAVSSDGRWQFVSDFSCSELEVVPPLTLP
jgi:hypothetical protein